MTEHRIIQGDVLDGLRTLPDGCVQCCITSPPYYGLRNYGTGKWKGGDSDCEHDMIKARNGRGGSGPNAKNTAGATPAELPARVCSKCGAVHSDPQIGLEENPEAFVTKIVDVFREVRRVLRDDGTLWLNFGDSYWANRAENGEMGGLGKTAKAGREHQGRAGCGKHESIKAKDMIGIPWMVAFALRADGWYLRSDIIWAKPNPMPESVTDRPTKAHEYIFLLTKSARYFYDADAIREDAAGDVDRKTFRGGGKYTGNQSFDNSSVVENQTHGNKPRKQDQTGNPTYTGFNERWKGKHSDQDPQSAGARMLLNAKRAREETGSHDAMFSKMARNGTNIPGHSGNMKADGTPICDGITRNARTVWTITTQARPEAHFATFPDEIPRRCISAGTSEYGCCPKCGAPYQRIVEASGGVIGKSWHPHADDEVTGQIGGFPSAGYKREFKGWKPGCKCKDAGEPVPCVVLDPFMGSGTVAVIARELNRSSIGCELNPEYVIIIKKRLQSDSQLDTGVVSYQFDEVSA